MARRNLHDARVLVTGASSGIGRALALELACRGARVVITAQRAERLQVLADEMSGVGPPPLLVVGDVTDPAMRSAALDAVHGAWGGLDILVNNAGVSAHGRFVDAAGQRLRTIMEVNFFAAAEFIRESIPLLRAGNDPLVVNVTSILGRRGIPLLSDYCASKFALTGLSEALRAEFAPLGIDLLVVAPGTTDTELSDHLLERQEELPWAGRRGESPERVARATIRAMEKGRHEIVPSLSGWCLVAGNRWFPRLVDRMMKRYTKE